MRSLQSGFPPRNRVDSKFTLVAEGAEAQLKAMEIRLESFRKNMDFLAVDLKYNDGDLVYL